MSVSVSKNVCFVQSECHFFYKSQPGLSSASIKQQNAAEIGQDVRIFIERD